MKILQILDNIEDLKEDHGENLIEALELSGRIEKEYGDITEWVTGDSQLHFSAGPETVGGYLSDTAYCDGWLEKILEPLQPIYFPDGALSIGDAENMHSVFFPAGSKPSEKQAKEIWKKISETIDEEFAKLEQLA
jgi:hypothetical protein